ncbi:uncharacterized protein LOC108095898 isoform X2 [Drosophila ficusphila]|uniref:uncharacterized protein LOC108095898 isoform X2 n=1 Tax=Drosophila ficusphila TaxID=30025 RepID=UPI0007E77994|nr:uncharacterized protein LOC108095898 isoform X2 [Drosophila ficusphila]XP_017052706.1 uncharacterized protein LOC108095898 isoform X2 [Drosophila ficusphila]XP_017052707.1 uncharacterized protein LOC108095898 isoform X2 [Drosophila ficusphila]XP_017052708.1 uncharacterized protein LOC108095898 isoform X2 [Drosophila ficusphila]
MELIKKYKQGKLTTNDIRNLNHTVICLMVFIAIFSILWSISLHMISGDLYEGIVSAKLIFRDRNFDQMNDRSKQILHRDFIAATQNAYGQKYSVQDVTPESLQSESQTTKQTFKIPHIYDSIENRPKLERLIAEKKEEKVTTTTPPTQKITFNAEADRQFLSTKSIDIHATYWNRSIGAQFVYAFPVISEIVAIIWTAMCLIFQTGSKKSSVLPKPWRIVVPSILIFSLMSLGSVIYTILTNGHLKRLCGELRKELTDPTAISCGDAIALLRPVVHDHNVSHDTYLELFRCSYVIGMVLWIVALLVMVLRFVFAVDFQLVDIDEMFDNGRFGAPQAQIQPVYTEVVQQSSPQHQLQMRPRSEDDYQSARSRLSDLAVPLLEVQSQSQIPPTSLA